MFMVHYVRYLNSQPSHVTLLFEYQTPTLSSIQVFRVQMVTVLDITKLVQWGLGYRTLKNQKFQSLDFEW